VVEGVLHPLVFKEHNPCESSRKQNFYLPKLVSLMNHSEVFIMIIMMLYVH